MRTVDLLEELDESPVFTVSDVERIAGINRESARMRVHRLAENGDIMRIERGKYTRYDDATLIASHIVTPSYLSLWSGLRYYDLTQQLPKTTEIIHSRPKDDIALEDHTITFHSTQHMFGFHKEQYQNFNIFVADREKLLIDCLQFQTMPVAELTPLLKMVDIKTTIDYTLRIGESALAKRVGYLLDPSSEQREELLDMIDANPVRLDMNKPADGNRDDTWKIIDNR